jgi:hypothetical protein
MEVLLLRIPLSLTRRGSDLAPLPYHSLSQTQETQPRIYMLPTRLFTPFHRGSLAAKIQRKEPNEKKDSTRWRKFAFKSTFSTFNLQRCQEDFRHLLTFLLITCSIYAFAPLRYIGTNFTAGSTTTDQCTTGYDNVGFIMGTSSSLFNAALTTVNSANTTGRFSTALQNAIAEILATIGENNNDISVYKPNPFWQYDKNTGLYADANALTLVDGGEDGQNIPLHPLIQPNRHVDVIFAIDSSADTNTSFPVDKTAAGWPGGVSLIATYKRSQSSISNGTGG